MRARKRKEGARAISTIVLLDTRTISHECHSTLPTVAVDKDQPAACWNIISCLATRGSQSPLRRDSHISSTRCLAQVFPLRPRLSLHLQHRPRERPSSHLRGSTSASTVLEPLVEANTGVGTSDPVCIFQHLPLIHVIKHHFLQSCAKSLLSCEHACLAEARQKINEKNLFPSLPHSNGTPKS